MIKAWVLKWLGLQYAEFSYKDLYKQERIIVAQLEDIFRLVKQAKDIALDNRHELKEVLRKARRP